jgi:hypothetical protein
LPGKIASAPGNTPNFRYDCGTPGASTYTLTATATGSSLGGATYTVDERNVRATPTRPPGWADQGCGWVLKKDGSC